MSTSSRRHVTDAPAAPNVGPARLVMGPAGPCRPGSHFGYTSVTGPALTGRSRWTLRIPRGASRASTSTRAVPATAAGAEEGAGPGTWVAGAPPAASRPAASTSSSASPTNGRALWALATRSVAVAQPEFVEAADRAGLIERGVVVEAAIGDRVEGSDAVGHVDNVAGELHAITELVLAIDIGVSEGGNVAMGIVHRQVQALIPRTGLIDPLHDATMVDYGAQRQGAAGPVGRERAAHSRRADRPADRGRSGGTGVVKGLVAVDWIEERLVGGDDVVRIQAQRQASPRTERKLGVHGAIVARGLGVGGVHVRLRVVDDRPGIGGAGLLHAAHRRQQAERRRHYLVVATDVVVVEREGDALCRFEHHAHRVAA